MANWLCEGTIMLFGSALYICCLRNWQPHTVMFLLIVSRTLCPITVVQGHNKQLACIRSTYSLNMHLPACGLPRGVLMLANEGTPQSPNVPHPTPPCSHSGRRDGCNQSEPPLPPSVYPTHVWRMKINAAVDGDQAALLWDPGTVTEISTLQYLLTGLTNVESRYLPSFITRLMIMIGQIEQSGFKWLLIIST